MSKLTKTAPKCSDGARHGVLEVLFNCAWAQGDVPPAYVCFGGDLVEGLGWPVRESARALALTIEVRRCGKQISFGH